MRGRSRTPWRAAGLGLLLLALCGAALPAQALAPAPAQNQAHAHVYAQAPAPRAAQQQSKGQSEGQSEGQSKGQPKGQQAVEGPDPIDFAVVVDLSKSLSPQDLAREVEAAALLVQGEISERSRAAVIGFGSSEKAGESAVREVCRLTVSDAAGRQRLSDCVQQLGNREKNGTGPGTDFPAAVRQAVNRLTEDGRPGTPKVVFLLTDGKLDVGDSPAYGADKVSRQNNATQQLTDELGRARRESVQIWPLGFGASIDRGSLAAMANGGYRGGCADLPDAKPRMRVVDNSEQIDKALQETFAAARCAQVVEGTRGKPPGELSVVIPPIATDGSITVSKHDRKVTVTYYDPTGKKVPTSGSADGSSFEASGQDGPVEALRVKNPLPGRWKVKVDAPEGHRGQDVAVRAIWQGQLRSALTLDPSSPRAGEKTVVEMRMQTRRGVVITDRDQLAGIRVGVKVTGQGFAPVTTTLKDDGSKPDAKAGDARFTGTLAVPAGAVGNIRLTGEMSAPGVTGDHRPLHTALASGAAPVEGGITVERSTVYPGGALRGTLDVTNNDTVAHTLALGLADQPAGSRLTVTPAKVRVEPGSSHHTFTVSVGAGAPLGELAGGIVLSDADDGGRTLDTTFLDALVAAEPTWWERWWWAVVAAAALVLAVAAFVLVRVREAGRRRNLTGVRLELLRQGRSVDELTVRAGQSSGDFRFTVESAAGAAPKLKRVSGGGDAHRVRRTTAGVIMVRPYRGGERALAAGEPVELGEGIELLVHDNRRTPAGASSRGRGGSGGRGGRDGRDGRGGGEGRGGRGGRGGGPGSGRPPRRPFRPGRPGGGAGAGASDGAPGTAQGGGRGAGGDPGTGAGPGSRQYDANF
ncbi:VWA domain-containing protein [Streptomyces sp. NPDC091272]|uniref:VWA domain-containing protein n=1 Tax=Streptomyces sp. NPDC091272 TaxID=3365981 RepID=UPI0037F41AE4